MSRGRKYVFTPARRAALRKATAASAKSRKQSAGVRHSKSLGKAAIRGALVGGPAGAAAAVGVKAQGIAVSSAKRKIRKTVSVPKLPSSIGTVKQINGVGRGTGLSGLRKNTIPYARINKRASTVGVNAGTIIPGTRKRIVIGGYGRVESINRHTAVDKAIAGRKAKLMPAGSRRARLAPKAGKFLKRHGLMPRNPATRVNIGGSQTRLGTSRKGGPTIIVRRGSHRVSQNKSKIGVRSYDKRMGTIAGHKAKTKVARPQRRKAAKKRKRK